MILGLGIDVIEIERIRRVLDRHGDRFLRHVFTQAEKDGAPTSNAVYAYYAGRWAAKESVSKALGTGIGESCAWTDVEILRGPGGRPVLNLGGRARRTADALGIAHFHITISHEGALACAAAVAEGAP